MLVRAEKKKKKKTTWRLNGVGIAGCGHGGRPLSGSDSVSNGGWRYLIVTNKLGSPTVYGSLEGLII